LLAVVVVARAGAAAPRRAAAAAPGSGTAPLLSAAEVLDAFRAAGLPADTVRQQLVGRTGPSGPPMTETEAWAFGVPGGAGGGRLMVFGDDAGLNKKAAWFRRAGAEAAVVAHRNVILWLDPALDPREVARYHQALEGLR